VCHVSWKVEGTHGNRCLGGKYIVALDARWKTTSESDGQIFPKAQSRNTATREHCEPIEIIDQVTVWGPMSICRKVQDSYE
jgi:hypothetical protein